MYVIDDAMNLELDTSQLVPLVNVSNLMTYFGASADVEGWISLYMLLPSALARGY